MPKHLPGLLKGKRISHSHQTASAEAQKVIMIAKKDPSVTKIVLGVIQSARNGTRRLKFNPIQAGFSVKIRGVNTIQELYIYTKNPEVPGIIETAFNASYSI